MYREDENYQHIDKYTLSSMGAYGAEKRREACRKVAAMFGAEVMPAEYFGRIHTRRKLFRFLEAVSDMYPRQPKAREERRKWARDIMRGAGIPVPKEYLGEL
jgi:hypothetical protein